MQSPLPCGVKGTKSYPPINQPTAGRRAKQRPSGPTIMLWVLPIASFTATFCPRCFQQLDGVRAKSPSPRCSSSGSHWWWKRGALVASATFIPKVDAVHHHLQYGGDDRLPPGLPVSQPGFTVFHHNGRRHRRQRTFFGSTALASPPTRP